MRKQNVTNEHRATPAGAPHRRYKLKRPIETVLALVLALLTLPVMLLIVLGSAVRYRAWPFFVQQRVGLHGRPFGVVKVRSLPTTAPAYADRDELADETIDRWGSFIRTIHLDELPQLWQVVTGTMGLVGPRPMIESIVDRMHPEHEAARHTMRPGVTGLWQISEYGSRLVLEASEYDEYYVTTANLRLDSWILWVTLKQTFGATPVRAERFPAWIALPDAARQRRPGVAPTSVMIAGDG